MHYGNIAFSYTLIWPHIKNKIILLLVQFDLFIWIELDRFLRKYVHEPAAVYTVMYSVDCSISMPLSFPIEVFLYHNIFYN